MRELNGLYNHFWSGDTHDALRAYYDSKGFETTWGSPTGNQFSEGFKVNYKLLSEIYNEY